MIYVTMNTFLSQTANFEIVDKFIDFLELDVCLEPTRLDWSHGKQTIRFILNAQRSLDGIEAEIKKRFNHAVEWEVYNDDSDERYIAQLMIGKEKKKILKTFLLVLFPEDYMFEL